MGMRLTLKKAIAHSHPYYHIFATRDQPKYTNFSHK